MIIAQTKEGETPLRCNLVLANTDTLVSDNNIVIDLINIFLELYANDIGIKRKGFSPRNIKVKAFVSKENYHLWFENTLLIEKLANFVTEGDGDKWKFEFIPAEYEFRDHQTSMPLTQYNNVTLLSGGLDSFCGAYVNEKEQNPTIYCGYKTSNVDTSCINRVSSFVLARNKNSTLFTFERVDTNKIEWTQRTRSLLFFSLAVNLAIKNCISKVNIYENGIMTLNHSFQTRGTTKTTHPRKIFLYQTLLNNLGLPVRLEHHFLFSTKGEMIIALNDDYKNFIKHTHSCSRSMKNPNYSISGKKACGTCAPCLLRKISMAAYDLEKYDNDYDVKFEGNMANTDYVSALRYFEQFRNAIISGAIFSELRLRKDYYNVPDYYERTYVMLQKFALEVEIFLKKYGG